MSLFRGELVIDDANFPQYERMLCGDGRRVVVNGTEYALAAEPEDIAYGSLGTTFENSGLQLFPRSEWSDRLKEQIERKARVSDFCKFPSYNQGSTNYCWANGPCQAATTMRLIQGLPYLQISSASIAAPIKGYRNQGGWGTDACRYLRQHGGCRVELWPNAAISRSYDTDASRQDRDNFKVPEWIETPSQNRFDYVMSACLQTLPGAAAYNWWRHLVMGCDGVEIERGSFGLRIRNSWSESYGAKNEYGYGGFAVFREGSKGTPSAYQIVRQTTASFAK